MLVGFIGCLIPALPGPPLSYVGLLFLQFTENEPFSLNFMLLWAAITILVFVADYFVPILGAKRYGGSKWGVWGSVIGLLVGIFFFPPLGIILGPIAGALIGELMSGKTSEEATRAAVGSFIGFLFGTLLKLVASGFMTYHFVKALI